MRYLLLLIALPSFATTYYVSNSGLDTNNGTSTGTPWQTVAHVNAQTFVPGDSILFQAGGTWREKLMPSSSGTSGSPITFGAYGTGSPPLLDGTNVITGFVADSAWQTGFAITPDSTVSDSSARNYRLAIPAGTSIVSGSAIRITLSGATTGSAGTITSCTIGSMTSTSVFDSAPTPVTFAGGSSSVTVPLNGTVVSDNITFAFTSTNRYGLACHWSARNAQYKASDWTTYGDTLTTDESSTLAPAGQTTFTIAFGLTKFEVLTPSGAVNVWDSAIPPTPRQVFVNSARGTAQTSKAALASNNDWFYDGSILYLYSTTNPSGKTVEATQRDNAIVLSGVGFVNINGIAVTEAGLFNLEISTGNNINIINVQDSWSGSSGLDIEQGSSNITVSGGIYSNNGIVSGGDNNGIGTGGLGSVSTPITISGVEVYGSGNAHIEIFGPPGGTSNVTVSNCYLHGPSVTANAGILVDSGTVNATLTYNVISGVSGNGIQSLTSGVSITAYNNTIYNSSQLGLYVTAGAVTFKNNILSSNCASGCGTEIERDAGTLISDYNDIYHPAGSSFMYWQGLGGQQTFASWQTNTGQDLRSITSNPLFNTGGVFTLQPTSPARNAGLAISGISQQVSELVPDMGAFEYTPGTLTSQQSSPLHNRFRITVSQ